MTDTFDLDAARARRLEASGDRLTFRFGGDEFSVLPLSELSVSFLDALSENDTSAMLRMLLGDEQFDRFMEKGPRVGDVNDLVSWVSEQTTGGEGNS